MVSIQPISGQTGDSLRPVYGFGVTTWSILSSTYINRETSTLKNLWDSLRLWDSQHIATLCVSHPTLLPRSTLIDAHRCASGIRSSAEVWMMLVSAPMASAAPLMASVSASSVAVSLESQEGIPRKFRIRRSGWSRDKDGRSLSICLAVWAGSRC